MKIQLDTINKTIKIEEDVNLGEFIEILDTQILPNGLWKEFKLETHTVINWGNPIIIEPYIPYNPYPYWQYPWISYDNNTSHVFDLKSGVYNINLNN